MMSSDSEVLAERNLPNSMLESLKSVQYQKRSEQIAYSDRKSGRIVGSGLFPQSEQKQTTMRADFAPHQNSSLNEVRNQILNSVRKI